MKPRNNKVNFPVKEILTPKFIGVSIILAIVAFVLEALSESDFEFGVWEPEFIDMYGNQFIWIIIGVAAICSVTIILFLFKKGKETNKNEDMNNSV